MFSKVEKITIPKGIEVTMLEACLRVSSPKVESFVDVDPFFQVHLEENESLSLSFSPEFSKFRQGQKRKFRRYMPLFTTLRKNIEQAFFGVSVGFTQQLDLVGVGYKADLLDFSILVL